MSKRQRRREEKRRRHAIAEGAGRGRLALGIGITAGATLAFGGAAQAATLTVSTTGDGSGASDCATPTNTDCTLRDAITAANAAPGSTITFAAGLSGTITLGSSLPPISGPTAITGPGASLLTVSGNYAVQPFVINTAPGDAVSISGLAVLHGDAGSNRGGGIQSSYADLTLDHAVISGNETTSSADGGGVGVYKGSLTVESSEISDNVAGGFGGGIYTASGSGTITTIRNSTVSGNTSGGFGGGIYVDYGSQATVENTTVYGNSASFDGGGIYDYGALNGNPGLTVTSSTVTDNTAYRGGGLACQGDLSRDGATPLTEPIVRNTIVSGNTASSTSEGMDLSCDVDAYQTHGGIVPTTFSLLGSVDPGTTIPQTASDLIGVDPQLGPLSGNGGPTHTQAPAATSPVIDCGSDTTNAFDQRGTGFPRVVDQPNRTNSTAPGANGADMGAVELPANSAITGACTNNPPPSGGGGSGATGQRAAAIKKCKKKYKKAIRAKRKHDALTPKVKKHLKQKLRKCKRRANQLPV